MRGCSSYKGVCEDGHEAGQENGDYEGDDDDMYEALYE